MNEVQKPLQPLSVIVESRPNILDELMVRVEGLEVVDLSLEILFLVGGGDPGVDDSFLFVELFLPFFAGEESLDIGEVVKSEVPGGSDGSDFLLAVPPSEALRGHGIDLLNLSCW